LLRQLDAFSHGAFHTKFSCSSPACLSTHNNFFCRLSNIPCFVECLATVDDVFGRCGEVDPRPLCHRCEATVAGRRANRKTENKRNRRKVAARREEKGNGRCSLSLPVCLPATDAGGQHSPAKHGPLLLTPPSTRPNRQQLRLNKQRFREKGVGEGDYRRSATSLSPFC
jgi:hypothetical protein